MTVKAKRIWVISGLVVSLAVFIGFSSPSERYFEIAKNLDIFASLYKEVNAYYVDETNPNQMMKTGIDAMLNSLDPYTNYIPEDAIEDFRTLNTGQYGGIGAMTRNIQDRTVVSMIFKGSSAEKSGLKIGDEVVKINDLNINELSAEEISRLMKGQSNTSVSLTVKRYGKAEPLRLDFVREKVKIKNVPYFGMLREDVGYLKLKDFTPDAGREVKNAIVQLKEKGAKKIILDLRGNPGGLLIEAVNISNVFIPKGKEVVTTKGKVEDNNIVYKTLNEPVDTEIPLAVLINSGSASASEIVAGTVQDYDRGVIVGQKSFGKGLVQVTRPLSYNSQLKVTTAKYYTPSGRCIQALDYSHRNRDGSVGKIPDSLKNIFRTSQDRIVYDGGGVDPDIAVEGKTVPPVIQALYNNGLIFDYATRYYYEHAEITTAREFEISDEQYEDFKNWLSDKDYSYTTKMEEMLKTITRKVQKEKYYEDLKPELTSLKNNLEKNKGNDLENFKPSIKGFLKSEIVKRYYLARGAVESSFGEDPEIEAAVKILNDAEVYNKMLH